MQQPEHLPRQARDEHREKALAQQDETRFSPVFFFCFLQDKLFYTRKSGKDRVLIASPSTWASSWVKSTTYTEFQISTAGNDFVFKATSPANAKKWVKLLSQRIEHTKTLSPASAARGDQNADEENHDEDDYHDLLMVPESGGAKAFFYFVYPMLFVFKYTIPDVRKPGALLRDVASFFLCITGNTRGAFCTRSAILFPGTYRSLCVPLSAGNDKMFPVTMSMSVVLMALMANVMMTGAGAERQDKTPSL